MGKTKKKMPATVRKVIKPIRPGEPEKADLLANTARG